MASPIPDEGRITRERYWQLVEDGVIRPDDRVELLDGVIATMSPQNPPHALVIGALTQQLGRTIGTSCFLRVQLPLDVSDLSVPEPDVAVVPGRPSDYATAHPTHALLVVEVADRSLPSDRLTKSRIYASGAVDEYWIVNLRDRCIEVYRRAIPKERRFADVGIVRPGERLMLVAIPGVAIAVDELLPPPATSR